VSSCGDYQKYYVVDQKIYHHIIDQLTLMPANFSKAVTVITEDAGKADFLATTIFLMPYEEGKTLIDSLEGVDAIWVLPDGKVLATDGAAKMMKSSGAKGSNTLD
jgi:thiamine biosynthesis lipoprotein